MNQPEIMELPFFFPDRRSPVLLEPIFLPLLLILFAILIGFCMVLPGIRGRQRIFAAIRVTLLGSAGLWLFFSFFCTEWIVAEANSQVQYFTHEKGAVGSRVKLQMGFSKVNITLKALDEELFPNRYWNERIAINSADDDFQGLMRDGVPDPILEVASHFTSLSSRGSLQRTKKFVLFFRMAFAFQILSILLWLVSVCIISKTIAIGGQFLLLSGLAQLICSVFFAVGPSLRIHLPGAQLDTQFGWCWSLNVGMGLFSVMLSIIVQLMQCFARETIEEFMNHNPYEEDDCFDCVQINGQCANCKLMKSITPTPKYKFESETSKAVRQIVNGCKLYPKALTMQVDNEVKFDKQRKSQKSAKKAVASPASISASVPVDQTLSYGDWKILEPGNFGSQPHFLDGFVSPSRLPSLNDRLGENNIIENEYYRTRSTLSESLSPSTSSEEC